MPRTTVRIKTPPELNRWARQSLLLANGEFLAIAEARWHIATDVFFDRTQEYVHIISGDLKASGRAKVKILSKSVYGEVAYGGSGVSYAQIEEDRGGDHAFLSRGWEATEHLFGASMKAIWSDAMERG